METPKRVQVLSVLAAVLFASVAMTAGYRRIGLPPVVIVGGSSVVALVLWIKTYLKRPLDAEVILPGFLRGLAGWIRQAVWTGGLVADMHNYWVKPPGVSSFRGRYRAFLPMIPGIYTIGRVITQSGGGNAMNVLNAVLWSVQGFLALF